MIKYNKKDKHRILFLLHIPPPVHGSSVVGQAIKGSQRINNNFDCQYINLLASSTVADSGLVSPRKIVGFLGIWLKVLYSIIRKRPKLCYIALTTTGAAFYRDLILVALLKLFRINRVYHLHNKGISRNQHKRINDVCYEYVFKKAEVILLSRLLYPDVQKYVEESQVHICPNGIPDIDSQLSVINGNESTTENFITSKKNNPTEILFLSNLIESKGVYVLLEACSILKNKNIKFRCNYIGGEGDVSEAEFLKKISLLGLDKEVNYLGKKFGMEKSLAYFNTDIFVFPTFYKYETFGLVNLEAMQHSKPVIATCEGGIPDVVEDGETGFLIQQNNPQELAEKIELLIENPQLREKLGKAGRKKYLEEFTSIRFESRLNEIFFQITAKHKS